MSLVNRDWPVPRPVPSGSSGHAIVVVDERQPEPCLHCANDEPGFERPESVEDAHLTDRERVLRALGANGGQLRQQTLVERSGWSKARMSRLLSAMADDGQVVKLSVGRENLICLPDQTPDIADDG